MLVVYSAIFPCVPVTTAVRFPFVLLLAFLFRVAFSFLVLMLAEALLSESRRFLDLLRCLEEGFFFFDALINFSSGSKIDLEYDSVGLALFFLLGFAHFSSLATTLLSYFLAETLLSW